MKNKLSINLSAFNNKRKLLKKQLAKESKITSKESMVVLHEFEKMGNYIKRKY